MLTALRKFGLAAGIAALAGAAAPASAQDGYLIGLAGDFSGPAAGTYKPLAEGVRIFVEHLNAAGGIKGRKIQLLTRDSRSDPNQVTADLAYLDSQKALLTVFVSPSGTIGAYAQQAGRIGMPTLYTNACYPPAAPPKPAREFFCPGVNTLTDSFTSVDLIFRLYKGTGPMKLAFVTTDIPGARGAAERIMKPYAEQKGAQVIDVAVMPVASSDATPIARSFVDRGVDAVISYTISSHMLAGADALARLGWKGVYLMTSSLPGVFAQMEQLKTPNIYGWDQFSLLSENKPVHRKIQDAAKQYRFDFPVIDARWGWRNGIVLAAALEACGWPCDREKLVTAMNKLKVDSADLIDLQGGPVVWSDTIHTSEEKAIRVYQWDTQKNAMVTALDWYMVKEREWR
ncbi:MAG: ABC transporter substrate-binding protein [Alphaproteobacteria bacterium]|nr:ABC transporter substrate-binding protein [Alphaproteobacteria bacterium]